MANAYFYSNNAVSTTLTGSISSGATSVSVGATTGFPGTPFVLALDYGAATEELVVVTGVAGLNLTVTRGFGGTSAQSHSLGAVVRHTYNAIDATDFRTHEAATSGVHGVTGALVGATMAQTLTNKTLTTPTINGAALTGTFSGTPTFSGTNTISGSLASSGGSLTGSWAGSPSFSGTPAFVASSYTGVQQSNQSAASNVVEAAIVTGDTFDRWRAYGDGKQEWGPGNAARDVTLYRPSAKMLGVIGTLRAEPTDTALDGLAVNLPTATAADLVNLRVNNAIQAAVDNNGAFRIYQGNAPNTYTPTVAGGGSATFTTRAGAWYRLGKIIFLNIYIQVNAAGSGSSNVTITAPTTIDRTLRQTLPMNLEGSASIINGSATLMAFLGGTGAVFDRVRAYDGTSLLGSDLTASMLLTVQGWYREA
jgi:hypothetical protein